MREPIFERLERQYGVHLPDVQAFFKPEWMQDAIYAMDAEPTLVTVSNAGIPSYLANYIDPKLIQVLVAPNKAAEILGEVKKGDWTTLTATFPLVEHTGEVSTYGDWNNNGSVNANPTFPQRQSYHYQTVTQWGERQLEMAGLAKIDWASRLNIASAMVLDKFQNQSYFFGVSGLQNYGLLNDPTLSAALTPATKAASGAGTKWILSGNIVATANEIYADIQALFLKLVQQSNSLVEKSSRMVLAMSANSDVALTATNSFNVNVNDLVKKNFSNIRIVTAPQYATTAGELVQLICEEVDGQETGYTSFTEKMRAHAIVKEMSAFKQKKSQGTWGTILFQPFAVASMIGV
jgi:hypothetical protein